MGMGMGGERPGARLPVEAAQPTLGEIVPTLRPPPQSPPHKGEGFPRLFGRRPPYFFTSGHLLSDSGAMISAAGILRTTLK